MKSRNLVNYTGMIVSAVLLFLLIRSMGEGLAAPPPQTTLLLNESVPTKNEHVIFHVLLALAVVIVAGRLLGFVFAYIKQPPVIGEVVAGILLGPSLLGQISPQAYAFILPPSVGPPLFVISQIGIILYMFLVGLELNAGLLREKAQATLAISHASIIAPFVLGAALALYLYPRYSSSDVAFTNFSLFLGVAMSITAFPVLARILTDRKMSQSPLGSMALVCAAMGDMTAWCLLACVVGVAQSKVGGVIRICAFTIAYLALMFFIVKPFVSRMLSGSETKTLSRIGIASILAGLLTSSLLTEYIGIHAIFGAFLFGVIIPHDSIAARELKLKLEKFVCIFLLPAFFAYTGMRTHIGLVSGFENWLVCALIIATAIAGKFGGSTAAARLTGMSWRDSAALGMLMNTRGLMEIIVLNIGLELKIISPLIFAMMVVMALVTTAMTAPLLDVLVPAAQPASKTDIPSSS